MENHLYTWTFDRDSKLIRFYLWAWEASAEDLNFCKLFWGILFSPIAVIFHGLFAVLGPIVSRIVNLIPESRSMSFEDHMALMRAQTLRDEEREKRRRERGPTFLARTLSRITSGIDRVSAFFQSHPNIGLGIGYAALGAVALAVIGGLGLAVYFYPIVVLQVVGTIVGAIVLVAVVALFLYWFDETGRAKRVGNRIRGGCEDIRTLHGNRLSRNQVQDVPAY